MTLPSANKLLMQLFANPGASPQQNPWIKEPTCCNLLSREISHLHNHQWNPCQSRAWRAIGLLHWCPCMLYQEHDWNAETLPSAHNPNNPRPLPWSHLDRTHPPARMCKKSNATPISENPIRATAAIETSTAHCSSRRHVWLPAHMDFSIRWK